jgi:large subunit ribosomal protein L3
MTSILGRKIGMTQVYTATGLVEPITVIEAGPCTVVDLRTKEKHGYTAVQLGFVKAKKPNKPIIGYFKKQGIPENFRYLKEFKTPSLEGMSVGQQIKVDAFKLYEIVSVTGRSIGKGFQGPVKRFHFNRGPMTHGSKSHRLPGSSGSGTGVGHVWKGKRRAGHMGFDMVTQKGLVVIYMDTEKNIIGIRGSVPGPKGTIVEIKGTGKIAQPRIRRLATARLEKAAKIASAAPAKK